MRILAYLCFAYIALVAALFVGLGSLIPTDLGTRQEIMMVVGIPAFLLGAVAAVTGIVVTLVCCREWPLLAMSASILGCFSLLLVVDLLEQSVQHQGTLFMGMGLLLLVVVLLSGRWVLSEIGRLMRRKHSGQ